MVTGFATDPDVGKPQRRPKLRLQLSQQGGAVHVSLSAGNQSGKHFLGPVSMAEQRPRDPQLEPRIEGSEHQCNQHLGEDRDRDVGARREPTGRQRERHHVRADDHGREHRVDERPPEHQLDVKQTFPQDRDRDGHGKGVQGHCDQEPRHRLVDANACGAERGRHQGHGGQRAQQRPGEPPPLDTPRPPPTSDESDEPEQCHPQQRPHHDALQPGEEQGEPVETHGIRYRQVVPECAGFERGNQHGEGDQRAGQDGDWSPLGRGEVTAR